MENENTQNLPEEVANQAISDLKFPTIIKSCLRFHQILTLGQLLNTKYSELERFRNLGITRLKLLLEIVHSWGYTIPGEHLSLDEIRAEYLKSGKVLIENLGFPYDICIILYKNDIFTLEELEKFGSDALYLPGFGLERQKNLREKLAKLSIVLVKNSNPTHGNIPTVSTISENDLDVVRQEIANMEERIKRKQEIIEEYLFLTEKRNNLLPVEKQLDIQIADIEDNSIKR